MSEWLPVIAAVISGIMIGTVNIYVFWKSRVFNTRKEYLTRVIINFNKVLRLVRQKDLRYIHDLMDENRTLLVLYGSKKEVDLGATISTLIYKNEKNIPTDTKKVKEVLDLISKLTTSIRSDLRVPEGKR